MTQGVPEPDDPLLQGGLRLRSQSDAKTTLPAGHWRIVGAWTPLRRGQDVTHRGSCTWNTDEPIAGLRPVSQPPEIVGGTPARHNSHRKRVSLFLRRQRSVQMLCSEGKEGMFNASTATTNAKSQSVILTRSNEDSRSHSMNRFVRRARSACVPASVTLLADNIYNGDAALESINENVDNNYGINGKYGTPNKNNMVTNSTNDSGGDDVEDEIIGEICLEKFADGDGDDDYAFLDAESVDICSTDGRPGLQVDADGLRWIGDEHDFAALFAEVGLDDVLDGDDAGCANGIDGCEERHSEFQVDDTVADEWRAAAEEHNLRCAAWRSTPHITPTLIDIRDFAREFSNAFTVHNPHT